MNKHVFLLNIEKAKRNLLDKDNWVSDSLCWSLAYAFTNNNADELDLEEIKVAAIFKKYFEPTAGEYCAVNNMGCDNIAPPPYWLSHSPHMKPTENRLMHLENFKQWALTFEVYKEL